MRMLVINPNATERMCKLIRDQLVAVARLDSAVDLRHSHSKVRAWTTPEREPSVV